MISLKVEERGFVRSTPDISSMSYFSSDLNVVKTKPAKISQILPEMNHFYEKRRHKIFKIGKTKLLSLRMMTSSHL